MNNAIILVKLGGIHMEYNIIKMNKQKHIALVAHDNMKKELIDWVINNKDILSKHFLCGTGTTSRIISNTV